MSVGTDRARRRALGILVCALLIPRAVLAQDPRAAAVQRVAREWLALVDKFDAGASWKAGGERFQRATPPALWVETIKRDREPRGALLQRTIALTEFGSTGPGLPDGGSYALVRFRSVFANEPTSVEEVTLEVGAGYVWRVIGYTIQ